MQFSTESVRDLARLLNESGLHEIALQTTGENDALARIVVRAAVSPASSSANRGALSSAAYSATNFGNSDATSAVSANNDASSGTNGADISPDADANFTENAPLLLAVSATAVGLFQHATPALAIGDGVKKGQVVGVVSSLKIPNSVLAPAAGRVAEFLVEEGQGVEYGQSLLALEVEEIP